MIEKTFIEQGLRKIELEEYLKGQIEKAGFTKLDIIKTPLVTRIVVNVTKPGLAIGKGGQNIKLITQTIEERFKINNPQIEIKEIEIPELDAQAMANKLKGLIERGFSWRSAAYRSVREVMEKGAQGVELVLAGKLSGKGGRKRKQRIATGYMKKVGDQISLVDYGKASAYPKAGAIGIKMRIVRPETVFPDKINIIEYLEEREANKAEETAKAPVEKEGKEGEKTGKEDTVEKAGKKSEVEKPEAKDEKPVKMEGKVEKEKKGENKDKEKKPVKEKEKAEKGAKKKEEKKAKEKKADKGKEKEKAGKDKEKGKK